MALLPSFQSVEEVEAVEVEEEGQTPLMTGTLSDQ